MHHLVERPSENSYGKRFVICVFQVALPLQFFFSIIQIMQILATLVREFLFLSARA